MQASAHLVGCATLLTLGSVASAYTFNGASDNGTDAYGYYYAVTGGKFVNGQTVNGDNGSGGVFRILADDYTEWYGSPAPFPNGTWQADDWFTDNAGLALTMKNGGATVYDNNGIEDNTYGDYYTQGGSHGTHGLNRAYAMSNNFDWVYAGYFKITQATTIDQLIGYFDPNGNAADPIAFNPNHPSIAYRMNIWSESSTDLMPVNTGGFRGDVFTSDLTAGTFAVSDTGAIRDFTDNASDEAIYRLTYTLDAPLVLQPGEYWFSHDAIVVPEPASLALLAMGAGVALLRRRNRTA